MKNNFQLSKLAASLAVMGGMSLFSGQLMAAAPLAGTNISNVATASYTDNTNTERVVTSNVVKTLVAQVGSFTLIQNNERQTAANSSVSFPHILTNNLMVQIHLNSALQIIQALLTGLAIMFILIVIKMV